MNIPPLIIKDEDDLQAQLTAYECKQATSLGKLCIAYFNLMGSDKTISKVEVKINKEMLAASYRGNPAMFANAISSRVTFPSVKSYIEGEYLHVIASRSLVPLTFKARVTHELKGKGRVEMKAADVPQSYRDNPKYLARLISESTGLKIATVAKPISKKIVWKVR